MGFFECSTHSLTTRAIRVVGDAIAPRGKGKGRLCILSYHRILHEGEDPLGNEPNIEEFRWQMQLLAESFNVLSLNEATSLLKSDRMPARAVCITFDDGYRSTHDLALPVLKEFALPATVFVASGYICKKNMWNDRIILAVENISEKQLDLRSFGAGRYSLETPIQRQMTALRIIEIIKYRSLDKREEFVSEIERRAQTKGQPSLMLTQEMIANLADSNVEIGGHTITHPILSSLEDADAYNEMKVGKQQLEAIIGRPVRFFAYPNGKVGTDLDDRHVQMAKEIGFLGAVTTSFGVATAKSDLFLLPRCRPWDKTSHRFACRLLYWLAGGK